jgi:hypothetical protein
MEGMMSRGATTAGRRELRESGFALLLGALAGLAPASVSAQGTLDVRVSVSSDDAEERNDTGAIQRGSSDLELVRDTADQTVGLRFVGLTIPQGAEILAAYVQFTVDASTSEATSLTIDGQAVDNAPTFSSAGFGISSRARTSAAASWFPEAWTPSGAAGPAQRTPDLSAVLQEIVDRPGWSNGNAAVLIISGTGKRVARSWDGNPAEAPLLHVDYAFGGNTPPSVDISAPANGGFVFDGDVVVFSGSATDAEDGDLTASLAWSSSLDGPIGSGGGFSTDALSVGSHIITASVSDNAGAVSEAQISLTVGSSASPILVSAGDIASCTNDHDEETAALLDNIPGTVAALGDNAYEDGSLAEFATCYDPTWGRHKDRTRPVVGNHEYQTPGAAGYFAYFGAAAGDPEKGYYSFDLAAWHVVVLNSNCSLVGGCSATSPQGLWLQADLAAHPSSCTLAMLHHPPFSSSGNTPSLTDFWQILQQAGADVMLAGHRHNYERFAPQDWNGNADPQGIRQFVVGTGGKSIASFGTPLPTSEARGSDYGVLKLTLNATSYDWEFVPVAGKTFADSGSASCVSPLGNTPPTATITAPPSGSTVGLGTAVTFTGTADDAESGSLTASLTWSSSINGTLGTGGSVTTSGLSAGTHTITASATDSGGLTGSASISLTVTAGNTPPAVTITAPPSGSSVGQGTAITFTGTADDSQSGSLTPILNWSSSIDGALGTGGSVTTSGLSVGTHTITASATDSGGLTGSAAITVTVLPPVVEVRIATAADDVEEYVSGTVSTGSGDLDMVYNTEGGVTGNQTVGLRFTGVTVPPNATILAAWVQFQADEKSSGATTLTIEGQAADNAAVFTKTNLNVSSRARTVAKANWSPAAWTSVGQAGPAQRSADISAVIQAIVTRPGWASGNALALILTGTGSRVADSYEGSSTGAPLLHVEYDPSQPANQAPVVSAGSDQTVVLPAGAVLNGTVSDDGLPNPPGVTGQTWSQVSGPGQVSFDHPDAPAATATFTVPGTYVLRLTADDGERTTFDEVTVNVQPGGFGAFDGRVNTGADDVEEYVSGKVSTGSGDLDMVYNTEGGVTGNQTVGLRFTGVTVPPNATILGAWVQFQADEKSSGATALTVEGQAADNAAAFTNTNLNVSSRARTVAKASWSPGAWTKVGQAGPEERSADISEVIREIVTRPGWASGNALALILTGTGSRVAESYEGSSSGAPLLHVEYTAGN